MTAFLAILSLAGIGLILGIGLGIAAKKFGVAVDRHEEEVMQVLPGTNCGACGFPGCQAYAAAVVSGKAPVNACIAGGNEVNMKLAEVMGAELEESVPQVAVVCCRGGKNKVEEKFIYQGINNCLAASLLQGGGKRCPYGCLGFGSCVDACPFGALKMDENCLPVVDEDACTGCGLCVKVCPGNIIQLIPRETKAYVACVSKDRGKDVREICNVGCFGCGICAKVAPQAITMDGNLPHIHSDNMEKIAKAVEKCPAKVLIVRENVSSSS